MSKLPSDLNSLLGVPAFRREVDESCALRAITQRVVIYYRRFGKTIVPIFKFSWRYGGKI